MCFFPFLKRKITFASFQHTGIRFYFTMWIQSVVSCSAISFVPSPLLSFISWMATSTCLFVILGVSVWSDDFIFNLCSNFLDLYSPWWKPAHISSIFCLSFVKVPFSVLFNALLSSFYSLLLICLASLPFLMIDSIWLLCLCLLLCLLFLTNFISSAYSLF